MRRLALIWLAVSGAQAADLTHATVVAPVNLSGPERKAVAMLVDAVRERTRITWTVVNAEPASGAVVRIRRGSGAAEGYQLRAVANGVEIAGNDERGVLFGVGGLLRALEMRRDSVTLSRTLNVTTAPKYALRGHQLGYRPKTNSYDGWNVVMWESYIRDLAVFGANAIELIPPRSDDAADSPHFPLPPMQMMIEMSRLAQEYGMQCWIWYPAMDRDYSDAATVAAAIKEWGEVFRQLPRVDAVFVPGGDPGHTEPRYLMALLEKQTENLRRYHPKATMWVSPQGFNAEWMQQFFGLMDKQPAWLTGVVFGPQVRVNLPELRARIPKRYPIRFYPDITHSTNSEFAVNDWDVAYAQTEEREVINPRPLDMAKIFRVLQPFADGGFLTYSEGCNDDVNKAVWSALGWNPEVDVTEVLRDYGRYFIGADMADGFAQGLLGLERNWRGALLGNTGVDVTLAQFTEMEKRATPQQKLNWRFSGGAVSGQLRRVSARAAERRDAAREARHGAPGDGENHGHDGGTGVGGSGVNGRPGGAGGRGDAVAGVRAGGGVVPERPYAAQRAAVCGDRCGTRGKSGFDRPADHERAVAAGAVRRNSRGAGGSSAAGGDRRDRELDQSGTGWVLRRSRGSGESSAFGDGGGIRQGPGVLSHGADGIRQPAQHAVAHLVAPARGDAVWEHVEAALYGPGPVGAVSGAVHGDGRFDAARDATHGERGGSASDAEEGGGGEGGGIRDSG